MLKRTKGLLLLTSLVITGLAGTINDTSLSRQERKVVINYFKDTRTALQQSIKGLSDAQLSYKPAADKWSIQECVYHITLAEKGIWAMFEGGMKKPAAPEKRASLTFKDENVFGMITDRSRKAEAGEEIRPAKAPWKSVPEAMKAFKELRGANLKYAKSTTEDLRNHIYEFPFGSFDGYQMLIFLAGHSSRHTLQIDEIKSDPGFPKK